MGFRFRRSARLGPLRFNFVKGGLSSISVGGRGASFNIPVSRSGGARTTVHNLKVLSVDPENHLIIVEGGIPGAPTGYVVIRKAIKAKKIKVAQVEKPKKGKK